MELLDQLTVPHADGPRTIGLYRGDLTAMSPQEAVDILVISAFPDDYTPTPSSLIGALFRKRISVEELSRSKEADLRRICSCWMSRQLPRDIEGIQFRRILCFEPGVRGRPPEVVGDIFRSLAPFLGGQLMGTTVAMPLVASGDQGVPPAAMLSPLLDAAVHWMSIGLPLTRLKIVEHSPAKADDLARAFAQFRARAGEPAPPDPAPPDPAPPDPAPNPPYDVFISYAHKDWDKVSVLVEELRARRPGLRVFLDRKELRTGFAWQQEIYEALEACRRVIACYSPAYLESKMCQEEFNITRCRERDLDESILFPILLYSSKLPYYMKILQYRDCREGDEGNLRSACGEFLSAVGA